MSRLIAKLKDNTSYLCGIVHKLFIKSSFNHNNKKRYPPINEVLFYGDNDEAKSRQIGLNNLFCVYYMVIHASRSIHVCVPHLFSATLVKCLISVHQKNKVNVRIIVHNSKNTKNLDIFSQNDIEVKVIKRPERLEHNFILIDALENEFDDAVAILGSIDYDTSKVNCNRETTVITSELIVVKSLKQEFDRVWTSTAGEIVNKNGV